MYLPMHVKYKNYSKSCAGSTFGAIVKYMKIKLIGEWTGR